MLCPACLLFDVERDTTSTVSGTQYCSQHGKQALVLEQLTAQERRTSNRVAPFTAPEG